MNRRAFLRAALALPMGAWMARYKALAAAERNRVKITDIKAIVLNRQWKTLVKVETDSGLAGYGESGATGEIFRAWVNAGNRPLRNYLIGEDPLAIEKHYFHLSTQIHNLMASGSVFSGIDMALWDLAGKILNCPVYELLGGPFRNKIQLYHDSQPTDMLDKAVVRDWAAKIKASPRGWSTIKLGFQTAIGQPSAQYNPMLTPRDLEHVQQAFENVREALGPDYDLIAHCHSEFDLPSAIGVARAVAPAKVRWLEDPLPPPYSDSWLTLKRSSPVPIMNGEKVEMPRGFLPFLQNQALDILHPDLAFCGGITAGKKIADLASLYRIPVALHNLGSYILLMACAHYGASVFEFVISENAIDLGQGTELMGVKPVVVKNSFLEVPQEPGLAQLNMDYLRENLAPGEKWWG